jgi:predicted transcriptional regulator
MKARSIPLRIDENLAERISRTAKRLNLPRSVLLRTAIELQLDRIERGALDPPAAGRKSAGRKD